MRHGEAANIAGEDSLRPLTKQGVLETEKMGFWLACCKPQLMNVFVSPYIRAQQTCVNVIDALTKAALLKDTFLDTLAPETLDIITPSGNARQVHDFIDGLFQSNDSFIEENHIGRSNSDESKAILFVSHMPFVSYLVGELTGTLNLPIFPTGAIAIIDYDIEQMQGQLVEIMSPAKVSS